MTFVFDPANWYWIVGGDNSQAYSSASGRYVPSNDAAFLAWKANGNSPTHVNTEFDLGTELAPYYPTVPRPIAAGVLAGYQQDQADGIFQHKLIKFLFVLNNRVRVLEGQAAFTVPQAKAYFKGLM